MQALDNPSEAKNKNYSAGLADIYCEFLRQKKYPVGLIYGNPDTGKSDTACHIAEVGLAEGVLDCFASNITTKVGEKITSLEEVKYWHRHQLGEKLFILDEAGINDDARNPFSKLNREIRHEIFIARKFNVHWLFVLQEVKDIDNWKHSELTGMKILKNHYDDFQAKIRLKWWPYGESQIVYDYPRTSLPFDTLDIGVFTLEKQLQDDSVKLRGLEADVTNRWVNGKSFETICGELFPTTGVKYNPMQIKRMIQKFCRQALRCADEQPNKT